jgi:hypothetical protein
MVQCNAALLLTLLVSQADGFSPRAEVPRRQLKLAAKKAVTKKPAAIGGFGSKLNSAAAASLATPKQLLARSEKSFMEHER